MKKIVIVGEFNSNAQTHLLIEESIKDISYTLGTDVEVEATWISSSEIECFMLRQFDGVWIAPGSPYQDGDKVLKVIQYAREQQIPLLATCSGFQYMVIEFARNVLGISEADSEENNALTTQPVIHKLEQSLVGQTEKLVLSSHKPSSLYKAMGDKEFIGQYRCNYGVNEAYNKQIKDSAGVKVMVLNKEGAIRGFEAKGHPFFVGTLFIPQLDFKGDDAYPIIKLFIEALF